MSTVTCKCGKNVPFRQTWLYLPSIRDTDCVSSGKGCSSSTNLDSRNIKNDVARDAALTTVPTSSVSSMCLCLPLDGYTGENKRCCDDCINWSIDEQISRGIIPALVETNDELRNQRPTVLKPQIDAEALIETYATTSTDILTSTESSLSPTVLYVAQGEIAHCTSSRTDILISDRATTCHLLALRSFSRHEQSTTTRKLLPLCTMTHLDQCTYDYCIRNAFETHYDYHHRCYTSTNITAMQSVNIELDIHIVGGFLDTSGTSRTMSIWIMNLLADLADQYHARQPSMKMILRTACITAANHNHQHGGPIVRGLGINCRTGHIVAAHCNNPGPAIRIRMARLWLNGHGADECNLSLQSRLRLIQIPDSDLLMIEPLFPDGRCCNCRYLQSDLRVQIEQLLRIQDDTTLLKYCSTSPEYEEDDFCTSTRASFQYILDELAKNSAASCTHPTSTRIPPKRYRRVDGSSNTWTLA
jgi:Protein N-terminal asparagine amidohydrolase